MGGKAPDVAALEREWREASLAKDEERLRDILHPDFQLVGIRSTGTVAVGVDEWIETLERMDIASLQMKVIDSVVAGSAAVATVDAYWTVRFMGHSIDERVLLTDVWVEGADRWQALRRHSSPVPEGVTIS